MTSFDEFRANFKQVLDTFDLFVKAFEAEVWLKNASTEDIKNSFKIAAFVEKTMNNFVTKGCSDQFLETLGEWWKKNNRTKVYSAQFFTLACDHLLAKLLTAKVLSISSADIAIRIYTAMFPPERFEQILTSLVLKANSYEAVLDFFTANKDKINEQELEARLLLNSWNQHFEIGQDVQDAIGTMLSDYKIEKTLPTLLRILILQDITISEIRVRDILIEKFETKLMDRSSLSKRFWLALFKIVDVQELASVCFHYEKILHSVMNFVIYIGSMMNYDKTNSSKWVGDAKISICPEITYTEELKLLRALCDSADKIRECVISRITEAQLNTGTTLWAEILRAL